MKKKICFKRTKAFYDIIKRRKQCREYFVQWMMWMKVAGFIDIGEDDTDLKSISYIQFKFKPHGRLSDVRKCDIYIALAKLYAGVGMAEGFEYGAESFFRYITNDDHSNLATQPSVLKREIMRCLPYIS